ncbi:hypothetical protein KSP39_PZI004043 [Platanthera zijinensis]|uniref:Uncharacterized protein n=1 Tax=Platanthera zijinensis TaxID=2320716 RepID=A0AAP0BV59_9ASPA
MNPDHVEKRPKSHAKQTNTTHYNNNYYKKTFAEEQRTEEQSRSRRERSRDGAAVGVGEKQRRSRRCRRQRTAAAEAADVDVGRSIRREKLYRENVPLPSPESDGDSVDGSEGKKRPYPLALAGRGNGSTASGLGRGRNSGGSGNFFILGFLNPPSNVSSVVVESSRLVEFSSFQWKNLYAWIGCGFPLDCERVEYAGFALGTWFFSAAGALIAIPVGIRKKSLGPLVFFGTTGTMLDIIIGISQCEREFAERQIRLMEEKNPCNRSVDAPEGSNQPKRKCTRLDLMSLLVEKTSCGSIKGPKFPSASGPSYGDVFSPWVRVEENLRAPLPSEDSDWDAKEDYSLMATTEDNQDNPVPDMVISHPISLSDSYYETDPDFEASSSSSEEDGS